MKKAGLIFFLFVYFVIKAQSTYYLGTSGETKSIIKTLSGGLAMIVLDSAVNLYKTDLNGNIIWVRQMHHSPAFSLPMQLTQDLVDSSFYIATGYNSNFNISINKIDKSGNLIWSKTVSSFPRSASICSSIGGGFILTRGYNYDHYLIRFDSGGNIVWQNRDPSAKGGSTIENAVQCKNGDYVISGYCINNGYDPQVFRVDSSGALKWFNIYDLGIDNDLVNTLAESSDKSVLICGASSNPSYNQGFYFRIDSLGNVLNFKKYYNTHDPKFDIILSTGANRVLMAGNAFYSGVKNGQNFYTYTDYAGTPIWSKTSGALPSGFGYDAIVCGVISSSDSFVLGGGNFIAKIDSAGNGFCNSDTLLLKDTTYAISILTPTIGVGAIIYSTTNNITTLTTPATTLTTYCNTTLGLNPESNQATNTVIYPNPVSSNSYFQMESDFIKEDSEMIITDVLGRKVFSSKLHQGINKIPVFGWNVGVYFFTIYNHSQGITSGKLSVID